ncbi:MAG: ABC transporter substrate-binding protein [Caulobacteraceae bacterium]|nr:ABC transporter substrate-binding protein [Caulobacter sp.]
MTRTPLLRAAAFALCAGAPAALVLAPAVPAVAQARDSGAEQFVQREASHALQILHTENGPQEKAAFRAFVDQAADVPRITDFVLGKYRRTITPAQYQQFAAAFRAYADSVYENRLGQYHGETLRVTGSAIRQPGDVVVNSEVVGGRHPQPVQVAWRVIKGPQGWKVVDVNVAGVWLAITERQDFVSTLDNNGGRIEVLINQLRNQTVTAPRS